MKIRTTSSIFAKVVAPRRDSGNPSLWPRAFVLIPLVLALGQFTSQVVMGCDDVCDIPKESTLFGADIAVALTGTGNTGFGYLVLGDATELTGSNNSAIGDSALRNNTSGSNNTATGYEALYYNYAGNYNTADGIYALAANNGSYNTANGASALGNNSFGNNNTATGAYAIQWGFAGDNNTATGYAAMQGTSESSNQGSNNTATGAFALLSNTTGTENTAIGVEALSSNTTASNNVAVGSDTLTYNTIGSDNTATGVNALFSNDTGNYNTACGSAALASNTTSNDNTAIGQAALNQNTIGADNTASGFQALLSNISGAGNTANGVNALYSNSRGSNNIGVGIGAGGALTTGDNNIDIGNAGVAGESAKIRIGTKDTHKNTFIAGIYGVTASRGVAVFIEPSGHLGTTTSSARFKDNIKPMDKASEGILSLQPVTFRYKKELDPESVPQFGLVAEDVAKINPDLVARDEEGKPYTVRYEAVNAMLLNEFLKEHRTVQQQELTISRLQAAMVQQRKDFQATAAQQDKEIKALATGLQKVSNQLELTKAAARVATNDQ
jgi:hypothetical protein